MTKKENDKIKYLYLTGLKKTVIKYKKNNQIETEKKYKKMKKITSPWYRVECFVKAKLTTDVKDIGVSFLPVNT